MGNKLSGNYHKEHVNTEGPYGIHMNGDILNAPLWPQGENNMLLVPRKLNIGDKLNISGTLVPQANILTVSLLIDSNGRPDFQNIPCLLEINLESNTNNPNEILIKSIQNGSQFNIHNEVNLTPNFITSSNFSLSFTVRTQDILDIGINDIDLDQVKIQRDTSDIRYIMIKGDLDKVNELSFQFA